MPGLKKYKINDRTYLIALHWHHVCFCLSYISSCHFCASGLVYLCGCSCTYIMCMFFFSLIFVVQLFWRLSYFNCLSSISAISWKRFCSHVPCRRRVSVHQWSKGFYLSLQCLIDIDFNHCDSLRSMLIFFPALSSLGNIWCNAGLLRILKLFLKVLDSKHSIWKFLPIDPV